jgi:Tfp pilus assembly protein PilN
VLQLDNGICRSLRRVPVTDLDDCVRAAGEPAGAVRIFADAGLHTSIAAHFSAAGWRAEPRQHSAATAAALHAHNATLRFVSDSADASRHSHERRVAVQVAAAAVALLLGAAALELWGVHRELGMIRERRADIRQDVEPLLAQRESMDALLLGTAEVDAAARRAPQWTAALYDLAMLLPEEAHLTRLYTVGDTVTIEGEGARAGAALQALRSARSLRDARLVGVVDRELADGTTAVERFRISARLAMSAGAPHGSGQ